MKGEYLSLETAKIIHRNVGEHTTLDTRRESNENVDRKKRYKQILECLGNDKMTAKEVAVEMFERGYIPSTERNFTAPRLTELCQNGQVEVVGKKKCQYTGKTVAVYEVING